MNSKNSSQEKNIQKIPSIENIINQEENQVEINNIEENSNNNNNNQNNEEDNLPLKEKLINEFGFYANINGEDFDPREVLVLSGDEKNREITQIIKFLCDSYPIEAITYVLQRCYYNTFSHTSVLDKIIKYLLEKYKDVGEDTITNLIYSYKENQLNINISTVNEFNAKHPSNFGNYLNMTKLVFYDYSKEGVEFKKLNMNEIFIVINSKYINNNNLLEEEDNNNVINKEGLTMKENDFQTMFLGENHHLFKRFCRRNGNIYVFNFIGFENKKIVRKKNKKKKNKKEEKDKDEGKDKDKELNESIAVFKCENEGCKAVYCYNFNSNKFRKKEPHSDVVHEIKKDEVPGYYQQNIDLLKEKTYITDIQLVRDDNKYN